MKILIEIAQQTNVQFFKNIIWGLQKRGHEVLIVARDRELTLPLLDEYGFKYQSISRVMPGSWGRLRELLIRTARIYKLAKYFILIFSLVRVIVLSWRPDY